MAGFQKHALIVGASRGLGLGLAETFLRRGWQVTATRRGPAPGLERLAAQGVRVETVDIDDDASVAALHERLAHRPEGGPPAFGKRRCTNKRPKHRPGSDIQDDALGDEKFDLIFVVAGVLMESDKPLSAVPRSVHARVYLTNAVSPILFADAFADRLAPGGTLAFMSSVLGSVGLNTEGGWENYRASKAALNTNVRSFAARHAARDFGVLLLHPGWVATDMGGEGADLDVATSAAGLADVIAARAGRTDLAFLDHRNETLPW